MKIALIAPPFISVPPKKYGGTELFVAELARGLQQHGVDVTVYTIGESTIDVPTRWIYAHGEWPIRGEVEFTFKSLNHSPGPSQTRSQSADIIHVNSAPGLGFSRFD